MEICAGIRKCNQRIETNCSVFERGRLVTINDTICRDGVFGRAWKTSHVQNYLWKRDYTKLNDKDFRCGGLGCPRGDAPHSRPAHIAQLCQNLIALNGSFPRALFFIFRKIQAFTPWFSCLFYKQPPSIKIVILIRVTPIQKLSPEEKFNKGNWIEVKLNSIKIR